MKTLGTSNLWLCESSSGLHTHCKVSGKGHCCVPYLGTYSEEVARSFLSASRLNCRTFVCPERPACLPAGCRPGGKVAGWARGVKAVGRAHNVKLYTLKPKETTQGEPRWPMNELTLSQGELRLWRVKKCEICASVQYLSWLNLLQQWLQKADSLAALAWVVVSSGACYRAQDESMHTYQSKGLSGDTLDIHCNTKLYQAENGRPTILGMTSITFQVLVYFNFKVLGTVEAGCFGLTIIQLKCKSKRACWSKWGLCFEVYWKNSQVYRI